MVILHYKTILAFFLVLKFEWIFLIMANLGLFKAK